MKEIIITENESQQRLDRFLIKLLPTASKGFIQKMIRKKNIKLNNKKADPFVFLKKDDQIQIFFTEETYAKFSGKTRNAPQWTKVLPHQEKLLDIIDESKHLLVVNKPANLLTQPDQSGEVSLIDIAINYLVNSGSYQPEKEITFIPACSNRLDRNTTGIVLIAKDYKTLQTVNQLMRTRKVKKYYLALVSGTIHSPGRCSNFGSKNKKSNITKLSNSQLNKNSHLMELNYQPLENHLNTTLLQIELLTGRSHQIRTQLAGLKHPILGDPKYGNGQVNQKLKADYNLSTQLLHSYNYLIPALDYNFFALPPIAFLKLAKDLGYTQFPLKET